MGCGEDGGPQGKGLFQEEAEQWPEVQKGKQAGGTGTTLASSLHFLSQGPRGAGTRKTTAVRRGAMKDRLARSAGRKGSLGEQREVGRKRKRASDCSVLAGQCKGKAGGGSRRRLKVNEIKWQSLWVYGPDIQRECGSRCGRGGGRTRGTTEEGAPGGSREELEVDVNRTARPGEVVGWGERRGRARLQGEQKKWGGRRTGLTNWLPLGVPEASQRLCSWPGPVPPKEDTQGTD